MRRTIVGAVLLAMASVSQAQSNIYEVNGNVGIGTATPGAKFDVNGAAVVRGDLLTGSILGSVRQGPDIGGTLMLENSSKTANGAASRWNIYNMSGSYGNSLQFWAYDNLGCQVGGLCTNRFTIMDNGNVGIGISNPDVKLHVSGSTKMDGILYLKDAKPGSPGSKWGIYCWDNHFEISKRDASYDYHYSAISILENGNIGMGIAPALVPAGYKLAVAGKILGEELRVKPQAIWPDYVFKPQYKLMPLSQVELFINENGHLPELPSAKEVGEQGIEVGANQALLLKKIEELTLYMIELKKENQELRKEMTDLKKTTLKK